MNVLEKILKEIEERVNFRERLVKYEKRRGTVTDVCRNKGALEELDIVAEIIRSHMDEARDTNVPSNDEIEPVSEEFLKDCAETAARYKRNFGNWIPVEERLPEDDRYILLSFENFSLPLVGRYEENEKGGAFYLGDCDEEGTCISNDLYVNAWTYLPERYRGDSNA